MKEYQHLIGAIDGAGSSICSSLFQLGGALR